MDTNAGLRATAADATDNRRPIAEFREVHRHYVMGDNVVKALNGVSVQVREGDYLAIMGRSGSGKSTMLNALAGRLKSGTVTGQLRVNGVALEDRAVFTDISAYVTQDDLVMETQTCEELLAFSARLRLPAAVDAPTRAVIEAIHATPTKAVVYLAGGGAQARPPTRRQAAAARPPPLCARAP